MQYYGYYWTSTVNPNNSNNIYYLITPSMDGALENYLQPAIWSRERRRGNSVRLVREAVIPTGVATIAVENESGKAIKRIVDGQVVIERDGRTSNLLGREI